MAIEESKVAGVPAAPEGATPEAEQPKVGTAKPVPLEGEAKVAAAPKVLSEAEKLVAAENIKVAQESLQTAKKASPVGKLFSLNYGEHLHGDLLKLKNTKLAANGKAAVTELGMLDKIRPGKTAAVAGAAAVTGMVLASMGNKGPSEQAAAVEAGRDDQQMARA